MMNDFRGHVCLRNYWSIGPWEPAYWNDDIY